MTLPIAGRPAYFDKYPTLAFERCPDGILQVRLHSDGGPASYSPQHHADWSTAFRDIGSDPDNEVLVITGTGDEFMSRWGWNHAAATPAEWERLCTEARHVLRDLIDLGIPVIAAVNGPATIHPEIALLSDIVIAAPHATFQDFPHFRRGLVPGDGMHILWPELIGLNRARYLLLTGQTLDAEEALRLGLIAEILPSEELLPRAVALASEIVKRPRLVRRYTRMVLGLRWKRLFEQDLSLGLALEGLGIMEFVSSRK